MGATKQWGTEPSQGPSQLLSLQRRRGQAEGLAPHSMLRNLDTQAKNLREVISEESLVEAQQDWPRRAAGRCPEQAPRNRTEASTGLGVGTRKPSLEFH